jgi:hypothetical protein
MKQKKRKAKAQPEPKVKGKQKRQRIPTKALQTGHYKEWSRVQAIFVDEWGMLLHEFEAVAIEASRVKGNEYKERMMVRRKWAKRTKFRLDWYGHSKESWPKKEGYFIEFWSSDMSRKLMGSLGPFDSDEESQLVYNRVIRTFGFASDLLIRNEEDMDWGEDDSLDWGDEDEDEDEWGEPAESDELDWDSEDEEDELDWDSDDDEDEDDGW